MTTASAAASATPGAGAAATAAAASVTIATAAAAAAASAASAATARPQFSVDGQHLLVWVRLGFRVRRQGQGSGSGGSRSGAGAGSELGLRLLVDGRLHRARAEDDAATARLQAVLEGHLHEGLPADVVGRLAERVVPLEREEVELAVGFVRDDDLRLLGLGRPTVPAAQQCFAKLSQGE